MRILNIEHRVVLRLLEHLCHVEVERRIVLAIEHHEAHGVGADLGDEIGQRLEVAGALRHAHGLDIAEQLHELAETDIELDPAAHVVRRAGVVVPLTAREFALLHYLMDRTGEVVSRSALLDAVWDTNYDGLSNVVDVHVANLRRKLDLPGDPAPIETIRGVGYRLGGQ